MSDASDGPEWEHIAHFILNAGRYMANAFEAVLMHPESEGSRDLLVDEANSGFPVSDFCKPEEGDAKESNAVLDAGSFAHLDRQRCANFEAKLRRC